MAKLSHELGFGAVGMDWEECGEIEDGRKAAASRRSPKARLRSVSGLCNPHFHFEPLPPNLWIIAIINIHAGVNAMKTLRRSETSG
jgi:hypothetical protein